MHYKLYVIIPKCKEEEIEDKINRILEEYHVEFKYTEDEEDSCYDCLNPNAFYDYYIIGGRYGGTSEQNYHCLDYPNVMNVKDLDGTETCYRLMISYDERDEARYMRCVEYWNGCNLEETSFDGNVKKAVEAFKQKFNNGDVVDDYIAIIVDYHE